MPYLYGVIILTLIAYTYGHTVCILFFLLQTYKAMLTGTIAQDALLHVLYSVRGGG